MAVKGMSEFRADGEDYTINDPNIADEFSTSVNYAAGSFVNYQGNLYTFTVAHSAGAWNASHVAQVRLGNQVANIKNALTDVNGNIISARDLESAIDFVANYYYGEFATPADILDDKMIYQDGTIVDSPSSTPESYIWKVFKFAVSPGEKYAGFVQQYAQVSYYSIMDSNNTPIKWDWPNGGYDNTKYVEIEIPTNGAYLYIGRYATDKAIGTTLVKVSGKRLLASQRDRLENRVAESVNATVPAAYNEINIAWKNGYFYANSSNNFDYPLHHVREEFSCAYMYVEPGETYRIDGYSAALASLYGILKADGIHWLYDSATEAVHDVITITIPDDGIALFFNSFNTYQQTKVYKAGAFDLSGLGTNWADKVWCGVGDSLTDAAGGNTRYYDYIVEETGIQFVDYGISGSGYLNGSQYNIAWYQRTNVNRAPALETADVITLFGSGNDLGRGYTLGDVTDTTTDTICGAINVTLDNIYECNPCAVIGVITPSPWYSTSYHYNPADVDNEMAQYSAKLIEICKRRGIPCLDLYHESNLRPWIDAARSELFVNGDGVHPNSAGHKILYTHFREFLKKLI